MSVRLRQTFCFSQRILHAHTTITPAPGSHLGSVLGLAVPLRVGTKAWWPVATAAVS